MSFYILTVSKMHAFEFKQPFKTLSLSRSLHTLKVELHRIHVTCTIHIYLFKRIGEIFLPLIHHEKIYYNKLRLTTQQMAPLAGKLSLRSMENINSVQLDTPVCTPFTTILI